MSAGRRLGAQATLWKRIKKAEAAEYLHLERLKHESEANGGKPPTAEEWEADAAAGAGTSMSVRPRVSSMVCGVPCVAARSSCRVPFDGSDLEGSPLHSLPP